MLTKYIKNLIRSLCIYIYISFIFSPLSHCELSFFFFIFPPSSFLFIQQTNTLFEQELSTMNVTKPFSRFVHTTYDAVWSIALALKSAEQLWQNESLTKEITQKRLQSFDYNRTDLAKDFVDQFQRLKFQGISVSSFV